MPFANRLYSFPRPRADEIPSPSGCAGRRGSAGRGPMRAAYAARLVVVLALAAAVPACARQCVPESLADPSRLVDLCAPPEGHAPVDPGLVREVADEFRRRTAGVHPPGTPPYHFLALSGGGLYGAFGVGVLNGWSAAGTRPEFDAVTGISTGALMSTFAFLGPQYDQYLRDNLV